MADTAAKPPKKVLFAPSDPDAKVLYTRFCKKATECERLAGECAFAHTYEALNPVLCAHERTKAGCTRRKECVFMHTNENKLQYVRRACLADVERLGIDLSTIDEATSPMPEAYVSPDDTLEDNSSPKVILSTKTVENGVKEIKSAYADLCEKMKQFKESWADIDEEERKYEVTRQEIEMDPEFVSMNDYNRRTMYRLWGDGTLQANRGDGKFITIEKNGHKLHNAYDILKSVSPVEEFSEPEDTTDTKKQYKKHSKPKNSVTNHPRKPRGKQCIKK